MPSPTRKSARPSVTPEVDEHSARSGRPSRIRNMWRKPIVQLGLLCSGAMLLGPLGTVAATASPARSHKLSLTIVFRALVAPSASFTATGTVAGRPFGRGATVRHVTAVGNALTVKFTWFAANGSLTGTTTERRTDNPNGSVTFTVTQGRVVRGAGIYRGVTGTFTGTGSEPTLTSPVTEHLHGTVTYSATPKPSERPADQTAR
jgi:hypothetical protein